MSALLHVISAFGLSGASGLNAFIPLLAVSVLGRFGVLHLAAPYDVLSSPWAMGLIAVLLVVELVIDKIPVADHVNDVAQTFIRPAAGATLFAAECGVLQDVPPVLWLGLGLITALGVHGTKAAARPVVNASTAGLGAPVVSAIEDGVSLVATMLAIFLPIVFLLFAIVMIALVVSLFRARKAKGEPASP